MPERRAQPATAARVPHADARAEPARAASQVPRAFPVVGIGASAGGLDACRKLLDALPAATGMAFIFVQHLDPTHESMMVELLAGHTSMPVRQASDGMPVEPDHCYTIPPGHYLAVHEGILRLSSPLARHGTRLPFDFLLHSLAAEYAARAIAVVLSGTGADGSLGLREIAAQGGLVIAQDPDEAGYDGMPRSAILTSAVDLILKLADIPAALAARGQGADQADAARPVPQDHPPQALHDIVELLRTRTPHDFSLYKHGTLQRRVERRMAMVGLRRQDFARYVEILRGDGTELESLGKDLLINVTSFFRDPAVFKLLGESIVPELVRQHAGPADTHLDRRMQYRGRNLFADYVVPRGDRRVAAQRQAAGVRVRRGCRRGGERARGPVSRLDRGGCFACPA